LQRFDFGLEGEDWLREVSRTGSGIPIGLEGRHASSVTR
jgi:hypothetical protein